MSIIGTWKVKKVFCFVPGEGIKIISAEEAMAMDDKEIRQIGSAVLRGEEGLMPMSLYRKMTK